MIGSDQRKGGCGKVTDRSMHLAFSSNVIVAKVPPVYTISRNLHLH